MGDEKVRNWLTSFVLSTIFGLFVTMPIQVNCWRREFVFELEYFEKALISIYKIKKVFLMTSIYVFVCSKYDESQDIENDFNDSTNEPINRKVFL